MLNIFLTIARIVPVCDIYNLKLWRNLINYYLSKVLVMQTHAVSHSQHYFAIQDWDG